MDTSSTIKEPNTKTNEESNDHHSPTFLLHDGFSSSQVSDIEMMTIQSVSYTSLKDLLSPRMQPRMISSPKTHDNMNTDPSWHNEEIPIKDPLVKQAALAYLQPMSSPREIVEKGSFERMCRGESGCLVWLYDVVWRNVKGVVWESKEEVGDDYNEDDDDEGKVDRNSNDRRLLFDW